MFLGFIAGMDTYARALETAHALRESGRCEMLTRIKKWSVPFWNIPLPAEVFKTYGIDFCCGGKRLLSDALREQNIDEGEVLEKLDRAYEENRNLSGQTDFKSLTGTELIVYIENIHHTYVKKTLPVLGEQTTTLLRAQAFSYPQGRAGAAPDQGRRNPVPSNPGV